MASSGLLASCSIWITTRRCSFKRTNMLSLMDGGVCCSLHLESLRKGMSRCHCLLSLTSLLRTRLYNEVSLVHPIKNEILHTTRSLTPLLLYLKISFKAYWLLLLSLIIKFSSREVKRREEILIVTYYILSGYFKGLHFFFFLVLYNNSKIFNLAQSQPSYVKAVIDSWGCTEPYRTLGPPRAHPHFTPALT